MGMYTELVISTQLKPGPHIHVLKHMLSKEAITQLPDHPLFRTPRWEYMLQSSSYYFVPRSTNLLEYDDIAKNWCFISRSDFKNYDNEIELFIHWLKPFVDGSKGEMIGYHRYEEFREPTIIYL